jgi:hypothetical protein
MVGKFEIIWKNSWGSTVSEWWFFTYCLDCLYPEYALLKKKKSAGQYSIDAKTGFLRTL